MEYLDEYIKTWNLVFTNTVNKLALCDINFDLDKAKVNYDGSISFLDLVSSFNILYQSFKKEYDAMPKLKIGDDVEALDFYNYNLDKDNYRVLRLYINKPMITNPIITNLENTILYLREINGKIMPYITNDKNPHDKNYYRHDIKIDDEIAKKYLYLFEKYQLLLEAYNYLKNGFVFGDGTHCIFTTIDKPNNCNLLAGLHQFKIAFGSSYFDTEIFNEIPINLGDILDIDYDNCKTYLNNKEILVEKAEYAKMLANVFVNKQYTKERKKHN